MLGNQKVKDLLRGDCDIYAWHSQRAWIEVNGSALSNNVKQLHKLLSPQTKLMAVVKADAYGHGANFVASVALEAGASWLGVATVPEGIQLRESGIVDSPILILGATHTSEQIRAIIEWNLQPTICTSQQALIFSTTLEILGISLPIPVHIKLDTGMSRLGAKWEEAAEFVQLVKSLPKLKVASIYSHLATSDSQDTIIMKQQQARFEAAITQLRIFGITSPCSHLANSAAMMGDSSLHYDMVRVGLAIYGLYPAPHLRNTVSLLPVMQLKARVTQVKTITASTGVSYNHTFIASHTMRIAVIGIGYADGIPRSLSNKIQVLIRGQKISQIGSITMDQMMLDVSSIPDIQVGEIVTLLGKDGQVEISAYEWADELNTISWEILCGFKHRLPRVVIM
ncbi:MAG TPA: alanine racemase [Richelia sp.]|nr:alanine racemase [Richelia sp.]